MKHGHRWLIGTGVVIVLAAALALIAGGAPASLAENGIIYVDADAGGANNGTSWTDAYTDLESALSIAVAGKQIWVAEGTYKPTWKFDPEDERSATFQMKNEVAIYGGFAGGETTLEERDWEVNETILSGDIVVEGDDSDNSYHVFYHPYDLALDNSAVLDGFTITGGMANIDEPFSPQASGGGMYNSYSSPTLTNCTFEGNSALERGGGMANNGSMAALTNCTFEGNEAGYGGGISESNWSSSVLTNCTFIDNSAEYDGGGMYDVGGSPELTGCTFVDNSAGYGGGGMHIYNGSVPELTNCTFSGNSAVDGGGMYNSTSSVPSLTNCTFWDNSASLGGGMYNGWQSSPSLTNCTFEGNSAVEGGGIYNYDDSDPVLTNCILWDNTSPEIFNVDPSSSPVVTYSDIQGGYGGEGNINADPLFVDADNGDLHLGQGSPCIDAGSNSAPDLPETDFEGHPRIMDGDRDGTATVDMGVDEVFGHRVYLPLVLRGY